MIEHFHAHNFRCLVNFHLHLDEANVLLGANGSGKTSVLDALKCIQDLVARGCRVNDVITPAELALTTTEGKLRLTIRIRAGEDRYEYALLIEHDRAGNRMRIEAEAVKHNGHFLYRFQKGGVQLYRDDYSEMPTLPFGGGQSGIPIMGGDDNLLLGRFRREIANCAIVSPCPPLYAAETRSEDEYLDQSMRNFAGWYRHTAQENMGAVGGLFAELGDVLPGFRSINLAESGENSRSLKAVFRGKSGTDTKYGFEQLSDGQRALIALYSLVTLSDGTRSLFIDEPDNYLSLREVQPWLVKATESCGSSLSQVVVISHHPVMIDYMAGANGKWLHREPDGPTQVSDQPQKTIDGLSLSETIARGWEA